MKKGTDRRRGEVAVLAVKGVLRRKKNKVGRRWVRETGGCF
jgi:hypothetical protein